MSKIILDCDVGIDDALAILWLADRPGIEIAALGSVHGNAHATVAAANAQHVFDLVGLSHVPVAVGAEAPLARAMTRRSSARILMAVLCNFIELRCA